jgi:regulator of protease activity HflC (stomatin/prohibitin superfamily)
MGGLPFALALAGCATNPAPLQTESSTSAIRAAEVVGAGEVPSASLYLQLAKEELDQAQTLSVKGEKERAESLLLRAEADANLAILLSQEQEQKSEATRSMERVRQLRSDNR